MEDNISKTKEMFSSIDAMKEKMHALAKIEWNKCQLICLPKLFFMEPTKRFDFDLNRSNLLKIMVTKQMIEFNKLIDAQNEKRYFKYLHQSGGVGKSFMLY